MSRFGQKSPAGGLREELGIPARARLVVVSSRLNPMKGVEYFLDAAAVLAVSYPDVRFLIVGDGANRLELEERARASGLEQRVLFTGFRTDVPELLQEATVSLLPSLSEGLSNSLLESMACGVPVVAASVGGNPEVIEHGVTGFLVPPKDSAALAAATARFLDDPNMATQFGHAGRRRVADLFSVERSVLETEQLYQRLLVAHGHV
jgi:glycosyltransferase involved in cell wall biosynthesis